MNGINDKGRGPAAPRASRPPERVDPAAAAPALAASICITGSASNAGKTRLAELIVRACGSAGIETTALKVTRTHVDTCPRENDACGVCDDLTLPYQIVDRRELLDRPRKDTGRYLASGARQVLWLLVQPEHVAAGLRAVLPKVQQPVLVAEGNSFRDFCSTSDVTLMALGTGEGLKPSAHHVLDRVDAFVHHDGQAEAARSLLERVGVPSPILFDEAAAVAWTLGRL